MKELVRKFCEDSNRKNGLLLIDMPTGTGKTHNVIEYIAEYTKQKNHKRIFFITTLIKNLPYDEVSDIFEKDNRKDVFDEIALRAVSNADSAIQNFNHKDIPEWIRSSKEYKAFKLRIETIRENEKNITTCNALKEEFVKTIEPEFRNYVAQKIKSQYKNNVADRKKAIKVQKEWQWVSKLYPNSLISDKKLIFMTVDKFLCPFSTIIEPSYYIYSNKILEDSIVFIDEFDATKETMLKNIISFNLERKVDFLDLFRNIYSGISTTELPDILLQESKKRENYKWRLTEIADKIVNKAKEVHEEHVLKYCYKVRTLEPKEHFLFHDSSYHTILTDKNLIYFSNEKECQNYIDYSDKDKDEEKLTIQYLFGRIRGFIKYFTIGVKIIAEDYRQKKIEKDKNSTYSIESAIETVLDAYQIGGKYKDYLAYQVIGQMYSNNKKDDSNTFDLYFYNDGFRYFSILDEDSHDLQSIINMYSFNDTPERIMLNICSAAKVVGISATATIPTVLGNYAIDYIKWKLGDDYVELTDDDKLRLKKEYENSISNYDEVNIVSKVFVDAPSQKSYSVDSWKYVFENEEYRQWAHDKMPAQGENDYKQCRYIRICMAYKEFIIHKDIKSFLCVLTKHPRRGDKELDLNVLYSLFDLISEENKCNFIAKDVVIQLDGDEFEDKKSNLQKRLGEGEKLFVISVYQTIGAGQNIQYPIPKGITNLVHINNLAQRKEKDFDAIYLDRPTNLVVNIYQDKMLEEEDFVKNIFQSEFLYANDEISYAEKMQRIKDGFNKKTGNSIINKSIKETKSYRYYVTRAVIQAIGRICRTNMKNKNIYIFADKELMGEICWDEVSKERLVNKEFECLLKNVQSSNEQLKLIESPYEDKAISVSMETKRLIDKTLKWGNWSEDLMTGWRNLRDYVYKHPTLSTEEEKTSTYKCLYMPMPQKGNSYYYKQEEDFRKIFVSFNPQSGYEEVSSKKMQFKYLMEIAEKESASLSEWVNNDYIMCPPLYNNIYKGALGELLGKAILENRCEKKLCDIDEPEKFEMFDYKVDGSPIYIDFKLWDSFRQEKEPYLNKVCEKNDKTKASCIMLINILKSDKVDVKEYDRFGICIVEIPSLYYLSANKDLIINEEAILKIQECYERYSNK